MIITRLEGGLGNQLFQYAAGRNLALKHGTELRLDTWLYQLDTHRQFLLDRFPIRAREAGLAAIWKLCPKEGLTRVLIRKRPSRLIHRLIGQICSPYRLGDFFAETSAPPLRQGKIVRERWFHFDPEVMSQPDNVALIGFWQSEKYFSPIRSQLLDELKVEPAESEFRDRIQNCESVSLHVRRQDFVNDSRYSPSTVKYCEAAMERMRECLVRPHFFIFSDDPDWVRQNLPPGRDVVLVTDEIRSDAVEEFRLMSVCRNHIVSASAYSWWAAWLNDRPEKVVIAPPASAWYKQPGCMTQDLLPADWITIPMD